MTDQTPTPAPGAGDVSDDDGPSNRGRIAVLVAGLLALVLVAAGLVWFLSGGDDSGSGGGGKKSASQATFCKGLSGFQADFASVDPSTDITTYIKKLKSAAAELKAIGVPSNMPQQAEDGYSLFLGQLLALPNDATADDVSKLGSDTTAEQQGQLDARDKYIARECPSLSSTG